MIYTNNDHLKEKSVCPECAGKSLGRYINFHGEIDKCDYCCKKNRPVMQIEQILPRLYKSWELYYESPEDYPNLQNQLYIRYSTDIIYDDDIELIDSKESFFKDLYSIVDKDGKWWLRKNDVWLSFQDSLIISWGNFCNTLKEHDKYNLTEKLDYEPTTYSPIATFEIICDLIKSRKCLVIKLVAGTSFFRTCRYDTEKEISAKSLGTAPKEYAKANRFSTAGNPMFYGSFDKLTCEKESSGKSKYIYTGEFTNSKDIKILDLTNIPAIPKLYDDDFGFIPALSFLYEFSKVVSKNVEQNELEYKATQIFTEYIRKKGLKRFGIRGIKYNSAQNSGGVNLVLFYTNDECIDESENDGESDCLILKTYDVKQSEKLIVR